MKLSDKKATLSFSDGSPSVDFPMYDGSVGPQVIDIRKLYGQTGLFTYDPGFCRPLHVLQTSPILTVTKASYFIAVTRSKSLQSIATSWTSVI